MEGEGCRRPPFPNTWVRKHRVGRVSFTWMAHTEEVWDHPFFQAVILGGRDRTLRRVDPNFPANLLGVTPEAGVLLRNK